MERDNLESLGRGTSMVVFGSELTALAWDMRWLFLTAFCLILVDFWFGCHASHKRGDSFRTSRAVRRTLCKMVDYICVVILGAFLGMGIGEPLGVSHEAVAAVCVLVAIGVEIDSIYTNWCDVHGISKRFSIAKLVTGIIGLKSKELKEAINESEIKEHDKNENA